jgi:delta-1-pyrroline-5-carboxylate synthetase
VEILAANERDVTAAETAGVAGPLLKRLRLTGEKLQTVARGITQLAEMQDPVDAVIEEREISGGLQLEKRTVPLGLLLVIFESRPEVLPQVAALAIRSGNGLLLKGGKEATESNQVLSRIIAEAIERSSEKRVSGACCTMVSSRDEVGSLLNLRELIDLVIPRGSGQLVKFIERNTQIPVLGHSEGVCHVYVHPSASLEMAVRLVCESKLDYPAACNAAETLLIDVNVEWKDQLVERLQKEGVVFFGGPAAVKKFGIPACRSFSEEYGDHRMTLVLVEGLSEAVAHINTYGSHHTDCIIASDSEAVEQFQREVDSASVFANASSRFADGFRYGLGCEVGISTNKIHARGPVGMEGLLSSKYVVVSTHEDGHKIGDCESTKLGGRNAGYSH